MIEETAGHSIAHRLRDLKIRFEYRMCQTEKMILCLQRKLQQYETKWEQNTLVERDTMKVNRLFERLEHANKINERLQRDIERLKIEFETNLNT